uniref:Putative secreted peptide n=1 Tax=Anopheles braziliensis TaxID=58242 RepID=A0A2M3ZTR5_9DIPT
MLIVAISLTTTIAPAVGPAALAITALAFSMSADRLMVAIRCSLAFLVTVEMTEFASSLLRTAAHTSRYDFPLAGTIRTMSFRGLRFRVAFFPSAVCCCLAFCSFCSLCWRLA